MLAQINNKIRKRNYRTKKKIEEERDNNSWFSNISHKYCWPSLSFGKTHRKNILPLILPLCSPRSSVATISTVHSYFQVQVSGKSYLFHVAFCTISRRFVFVIDVVFNYVEASAFHYVHILDSSNSWLYIHTSIGLSRLRFLYCSTNKKLMVSVLFSNTPGFLISCMDRQARVIERLTHSATNHETNQASELWLVWLCNQKTRWRWMSRMSKFLPIWFPWLCLHKS